MSSAPTSPRPRKTTLWRSSRTELRAAINNMQIALNEAHESVGRDVLPSRLRRLTHAADILYIVASKPA